MSVFARDTAPLTILHERDLPLEHVDNTPFLREVLDWWQQFDELPLMADVTPFVIPSSILPRVALLVLDGQLMPRVKLAGTQICEEMGGELRGRCIDGIYDGENLAIILKGIRACVEAHAPHFAEREYVTTSGNSVTYRRLLLPLASAAGVVVGILSCAIATQTPSSRTYGKPLHRDRVEMA